MMTYNPDQEDDDQNGIGDACDDTQDFSSGSVNNPAEGYISIKRNCSGHGCNRVPRDAVVSSYAFNIQSLRNLRNQISYSF